MSNVIINPAELEKEAASYEKTAKATAAEKCPAETLQTNISGIRKYLECLQSFQKTVTAFSEMSVKDAKNLLAIESDWLHLDQDTANKILK